MTTNRLARLWYDRYQNIPMPSAVANERGSVVILALIMLVLLTLVGTSATNTSTLEIQVAGNERVYKQNFYKAEATALQAFQWIENTLTDATSDGAVKNATFKWVSGGSNTAFNNVAANWTDMSALQTDYTNLYSLVVHTGVAAGGSLDMAATTQIHAYSVYGQYAENADNDTSNNERLVIETGYKKRF